MKRTTIVLLAIILGACGQQTADTAEGAPVETGNTTHRIDSAIVVAAMTAAGFKLDGHSDILRNPDDDYEKSVFDPELRGKTDRFVLRFVRAE